MDTRASMVMYHKDVIKYYTARHPVAQKHLKAAIEARIVGINATGKA